MLNGQPPTFVLGILQRSGTNYLSDLLCIHPDCSPPGKISEAHIVRYSDNLLLFSRLVTNRWTPEWGVEATLEDFCRSLGDGLISFLESQSEGARVVTKTPSVENIGLFPLFFPAAKLIILVRDGRDVLESGSRSFGWNFEAAVRQWAVAAQAICDFAEQYRERWPNFLVVKYEDLFRDVRTEMFRIMAFLELDESLYDFECAATLPIRGSSELRARGESAIHWKPIARTPDFNPLERWRYWSTDMLDRFDWIAGQQLKAFGYASDADSARTRRRQVVNRFRDASWLVQTKVNKVRSKVDARLARLTAGLTR